jgi:hypothetical protein
MQKKKVRKHFGRYMPGSVSLIGSPQVLWLLAHNLREHLVQRLDNEVHKRPVSATWRRSLLELARVLIEPVVAPQPLGKLHRIKPAVCVGVYARKLLYSEGETENG